MANLIKRKYYQEIELTFSKHPKRNIMNIINSKNENEFENQLYFYDLASYVEIMIE